MNHIFHDDLTHDKLKWLIQSVDEMFMDQEEYEDESC
jgi:hypothetical protein